MPSSAARTTGDAARTTPVASASAATGATAAGSTAAGTATAGTAVAAGAATAGVGAVVVVGAAAAKKSGRRIKHGVTDNAAKLTTTSAGGPSIDTHTTT
jgi:hypothetical protein